MRPDEVPDNVEFFEDGWNLDLAGVMDPRPTVPVLPVALLGAALVIGALSTWWLVLPFAAIAVTTVAPQGGTLIHGLAVKQDQLEILGVAPVPLDAITNPRPTDRGIQLNVHGVPRELVLQGEPADWAWIVTTLHAELERSGLHEVDA